MIGPMVWYAWLLLGVPIGGICSTFYDVDRAPRQRRPLTAPIAVPVILILLLQCWGIVELAT